MESPPRGLYAVFAWTPSVSSTLTLIFSLVLTILSDQTSDIFTVFLALAGRKNYSYPNPYLDLNHDLDYDLDLELNPDP